MNIAMNLDARWFRYVSLFLVAATVLSGATASRGQEAAPTEEERNAALEESLSGAALVGHFTVTGRDGEMRPREERYELSSVKHLEGDTWLITARIKYGENDVELPLPLPIRWAGDTPVITVDEFAFPGLGTYTARVMIYRDHYAGFWTGKDHGGHLFGTIERPKADAAEEPAAEPAPDDDAAN